MYTLKRSGLFRRQFLKFVTDYKELANVITASNFIDSVENSTAFIAKNPQACAVYTNIANIEYRKWPLSDFPHSIFFRMDNDTIILEALYAHRMNIPKRLPSDIKA